MCSPKSIGLTDMKQPTIAVVVVIALLGAAVLGDASAQSGSNLIVAGQSIGLTTLASNI